MSTVHMLYGSFILALDLLPCLAPATLRPDQCYGARPELKSVDAEAAAAKREGRCRPVCRQVLASVHACMHGGADAASAVRRMGGYGVPSTVACGPRPFSGKASCALT
jgi:hypothetical protein